MHSSRRKRGNQKQEALGRSRGGFSTKIHLRTNAKGDPLTFDVTGGEVHETQGFDALMALHDARPAKLRGDKGYDSDEIRDDLAKSQYQTVVPPRDGLAPQFGQHREPVHIAPRPSSLFSAAINQAAARVRAAPSGWSG
jgi:Transposase DDE domain